jgi:CubicO group peptidase (beta-lactamase class C family)
MRRPPSRIPLVPALLLTSLLSSCSAGGGGALDGVDCREDVVAPLSTLEDQGLSGAVVVSTPGLACAAGFSAADDDGEPVTAGTVFSIGSVTKVMTAAAVVELAEEGRLGLGDAVGRHLTSLPPEVGAVTLRQLLGHTGGLGTTHGVDDEPLGKQAALDRIGAQDLLFEPGAEYAYSNSGYTLLAAVVEEVAGSYRRFVVDEVLTLPDGRVLGGFWDGDLQARGPRATGYAEDGSVLGAGGADGEFWALEGNGGIAMSPEALHDWVRALAAGDVLPDGGLERMTTVDEGSSEALGFGVIDDASGARALVAAGGGGTGHNVVVVWVPAAELVAVVATNRAAVRAEDVARPLVTSLLSGEPVALPVVGVDVDPEQLAALAGRYELDDGSALTVAPADGGVEVTAEGRAALAALHPSPSGDDEARAHEQMVEAFLAGRTGAGREELARLREDLGEVSAAEVVGTAFLDGEHRTYVTVTADGTAVPGYLALDGNGQLRAAEYGAAPPARRLVRTEDGRWVPAVRSDVELSVRLGGDGTMVLATPQGAVTATREG